MSSAPSNHTKAPLEALAREPDDAALRERVARVFVPREARRRLRAMLAICRKNGLEAEARGRPDFREHLVGPAADLAMVQPALGAEMLRQARAL